MKHDRNMCSKSIGITKAKNVRNMIPRKLDTKNMISHKNLKHDNYVYETWIVATSL
jgi:hypothetical protein